MAEPERTPTPAADQTAAAKAPAAPHYSLSEVGQPSQIAGLLHWFLILTPSHFRLFLTLCALTESREHHSLTITARDLCKLSKVSTSAFGRAVAQLESLNLITVRHGNNHRQNAYQVNFFDTVCVSFSETQNASGVSVSETPASLFPIHCVSKSETPPTENKELARAAAPLDSDCFSDKTLDRVLRSRISDFDKDVARTFRRSLQYFMNKFGVNSQDRRYLDSGEPPNEPDNEVLARFLAVAHPQQLMDLLENLLMDAKQEDARTPESGRHSGGTYNPRSYAWFVYVALSRLEGIHFRKTKAAEQQFRLHKRGQAPRAPAAPQPGQLFENHSVEQRQKTDTAALLRQAAAGVKNLR